MAEQKGQQQRSAENLSWETPEYTHRPKSGNWFWVLGIISVGGIVVAILLNNFLFAVLIVVGALTLAIFGSREPSSLTITLSDRGILINERRYTFSSIESFWVSLETEPPRLLIMLKHAFFNKVTLPIEEISPDTVRVFLTHHLREKEEEAVTLSEHLAEWLGF